MFTLLIMSSVHIPLNIARFWSEKVHLSIVIINITVTLNAESVRKTVFASLRQFLQKT